MTCGQRLGHRLTCREFRIASTSVVISQVAREQNIAVESKVRSTMVPASKSPRNTNISAWAQEQKEEMVTSPTRIYDGNGILVNKGDYGHAIEQACYQRRRLPLDPVLM